MKNWKSAVFAVIAILILVVGCWALGQERFYKSPYTLTTRAAEDQSEYPTAYEAVSIRAAQDVYRSTDEWFYFELVNGTDSILRYGDVFQYYQDGVWYFVPTAPGIMLPAPQKPLNPMEIKQEGIGLGTYIPLTAGTYRIVIYMDGSEAEPPYNEKFTISYSFEVVE